MWSCLFMVLVIATGCSRPAGTAGPTAIRIDDPDHHWRDHGFIEMVTALEPPTTAGGRDRITVWLALPAGGMIGAGPSLRYPPGTVADRVEYLGDRVGDVRGTRFLDGGAELFHVLRPEGSAGRALAGYEWRRGDADAEQRAAELAAVLVPAAARDRFRRFNDCASCHQHDRPQAVRDDTAGPPRATDTSGLYQMLAVLSDAAPLDHHRPREVNVDRPYLHVECAGGRAAELHDDGGGGRHYVCADHGIPIGRVDIARARLAGDARALAVCRSRSYLRDHMAPALRTMFAAAFAACGL